jgi:hypothetical protein
MYVHIYPHITFQGSRANEYAIQLEGWKAEFSTIAGMYHFNVCVYVCMYVCFAFEFATECGGWKTPLSSDQWHVFMHARMCVCVSALRYVCLNTYINAYTCVQACTEQLYVCVCVCVCTRAHACICACVRVQHMCIYMYTFAYSEPG